MPDGLWGVSLGFGWYGYCGYAAWGLWGETTIGWRCDEKAPARFQIVYAGGGYASGCERIFGNEQSECCWCRETWDNRIICWWFPKNRPYRQGDEDVLCGARTTEQECVPLSDIKCDWAGQARQSGGNLAGYGRLEGGAFLAPCWRSECGSVFAWRYGKV